MAARAFESGSGHSALLARCLRDDPGAWRELWVQHFDRVARFVERIGVPLSDVPDVVQEVFVTVHRKLVTFDGRVLFSTWLLGIALRQAKSQRRRNWRRRVGRLVGFGGPPPASTPEELLDREERSRELSWVLDRMREKQRIVFVLYEIEELEGPQIAAIVRAPLPTVWSRLRLARADFGRLLAIRKAQLGKEAGR